MMHNAAAVFGNAPLGDFNPSIMLHAHEHTAPLASRRAMHPRTRASAQLRPHPRPRREDIAALGTKADSRVLVLRLVLL